MRDHMAIRKGMYTIRTPQIETWHTSTFGMCVCACFSAFGLFLFPTFFFSSSSSSSSSHSIYLCIADDYFFLFVVVKKLHSFNLFATSSAKIQFFLLLCIIHLLVVISSSFYFFFGWLIWFVMLANRLLRIHNEPHEMFSAKLEFVCSCFIFWFWFCFCFALHKIKSPRKLTHFSTDIPYLHLTMEEVMREFETRIKKREERSKREVVCVCVQEAKQDGMKWKCYAINGQQKKAMTQTACTISNETKAFKCVISNRHAIR